MLHRHGILARKYFWPGAHRMEPYHSLYPHARRLLTHTERLAQRILVLPTGTEITSGDIRRVCGLLREAAGAAGVRPRVGVGALRATVPTLSARAEPELGGNAHESSAPVRRRTN